MMTLHPTKDVMKSGETKVQIILEEIPEKMDFFIEEKVALSLKFGFLKYDYSLISVPCDGVLLYPGKTGATTSRR